MTKRGWTKVGGAAAVWAPAAVWALGLTGCPLEPSLAIDPPGGAGNGAIADSLSLDPRIDEAARGPSVALPPITGGTLHVTARESLIVSDPDRDRVVVLDLVSRRVSGSVALPEGSFPSRIAEDAEGRIHVVLRGRGEVLSFDPRSPADAVRHAVCAEPRGIGYDATGDVVRVGCRDGSLYTLATGGEVLSHAKLPIDDIRDVIPLDGMLYVTTFRAAQLHVVDASTMHVLSSVAPETRTDTATFGGEEVDFLPEVAWRTVVRGSRLFMVHQRGAERVVAPPTQPSYYGNGFSCGSAVVESVVTQFELDGERTRGGQHFSVQSATLPVDLAVAPSGDVVIVAAAEQNQLPSAYRVNPGELAAYDFGPCDQAWTASAEYEGGGAIAVAVDHRGHSILQLRDPAVILIDTSEVPAGSYASYGRTFDRVALGGESRFDAGHALFHGNAGLGLACASCHPEGGDDGRVWEFPGFPALRTPAMHGGMADTAPFHWQGDLPSMAALTNEVFERRMGGPTMLPRHEGALVSWLDALPGSSPREDLDAAAVDRGARLFWGEAQCGSCHVGGMLTDNENYDVGTGMSLQVPSLVGVSYRLPVMHDGCAHTLEQRFDPSCGGGDRHGHTSQLRPEQIGDLVSYLETL